MKHKWWHFAVIQDSSHEEKATSYCGKFLWHHFEYSLKECHVCNMFSIRLRDYKNGKNHVMKWVELDEITKLIGSVK